MPKVDPTLPPIEQGLQTIAVGKVGSKSLPSDLTQKILKDLRNNKVAEVAKGAFFGALYIKGIEAEEWMLEEAFEPDIMRNPEQLVNVICNDSPHTIKDFCTRLLMGEELTLEEAYQLGIYLFSDQPGETARGIAASVLRVRYETDDEYEGLLKAIQETLEAPFKQPVPKGDPIVQLAEPFDGVKRSYMVAPLLAQGIQEKGYRVINLVGRSSGPKFVLNLRDIYQELSGSFAASNKDLGNPKPRYGWAMDQAALSSKLDVWVERRWKIKKRPFLATLEKFINPSGARILITSAFHAPYTDKMVAAGERAGFPGIVVLRKGVEGTLASSLNRPVEFICSARTKTGHKRKVFDISPYDLINEKVEAEYNIADPMVSDNAQLIRQFSEKGSSDDERFDLRVRLSQAVLYKAMEWIESTLDA